MLELSEELALEGNGQTLFLVVIARAVISPR